MFNILLSQAFAIALSTSPLLKLQDQPTQEQPPIETPPYQVTGQPAGQGGGNAFNPQIGLVTDGRAVLRARDKADETATLAEAELSLAAPVDPFLFAEAFIAVANEDGESIVEIEEAFGTYTNLGKNSSGRFGKFKAAVGRANRQHTHSLAYMDLPLVIQDTFGEEGLAGVGAELSYLIPAKNYLDVIFQVFSPEDGPVFMNSRASNPVALAHLRSFFDFSEDLSGQLGFTAANGPTSQNRANVLGVDYTMKWQPGTVGRFWQLETEAYWADPIDSASDRTLGWFAAFTTQLTQRLFGTLRFDFSEVPGTGERRRGWTANLTLRPTEFHHWRLEFQHVDNRLDPNQDTLTLQFVWLIGSHPVHKY